MSFVLPSQQPWHCILLYIFRPKLILFLKNPLGWIFITFIFSTKRIFQFNLVFKLFKNTVFEKKQSHSPQPREIPCHRSLNHWAILYYWRECSGKKVSPKTWRIFAWNDAITMATGSSGSWKNHWPGSIWARYSANNPPGFSENIYWILEFLQQIRAVLIFFNTSFRLLTIWKSYTVYSSAKNGKTSWKPRKIWENTIFQVGLLTGKGFACYWCFIFNFKKHNGKKLY